MQVKSGTDKSQFEERGLKLKVSHCKSYQEHTKDRLVV